MGAGSIAISPGQRTDSGGRCSPASVGRLRRSGTRESPKVGQPEALDPIRSEDMKNEEQTDQSKESR